MEALSLLFHQVLFEYLSLSSIAYVSLETRFSLDHLRVSLLSLHTSLVRSSSGNSLIIQYVSWQDRTVSLSP
jgi:hypothetical protein